MRKLRPTVLRSVSGRHPGSAICVGRDINASDEYRGINAPDYEKAKTSEAMEP